MQYPFWDVPAGYGILMAFIAVLHVFISHFAIGGGFFLVVSERAARKAGDDLRLAFLMKLSKFFVLVTLVTGALTGVGIWFVIGLLSPAATEVLIHNFVWAWATEWTMFVVEILAAILYFYGWRRMAPSAHMFIGWVYFVFAWLSLFVINGIVTFMLTPGEWLTTGDFWDAFFNPTFWPSLVLRSCIAAMLAGLYSLLVASRCEPAAFKSRMVRQTASWGLFGLAGAIPSLYWYWKCLPSSVTVDALPGMTIPIRSLQVSWWFAGAIAVLLLVFGWLLPRRMHAAVAVAALAAGIGWFGSLEWFRESARKPYVIAGYMYGNSVEVAQEESYRAGGYLRSIAYRTGDDGADLFRHACRSCHTIRGYRPLHRVFDGTDRRFIASAVRGIHLLRGNMPPFLGTETEADQVAGYIEARTDRRHLSEIYGLRGLELGRKVFDVRCGICHPMGGKGDKIRSLAGLAEENYQTMLDIAADLGAGMPPFTGDAVERASLVEFLKTLKAAGGN